MIINTTDTRVRTAILKYQDLFMTFEQVCRGRCFITGTAAIGPYKPGESDIDIVILISDRRAIHDKFGKYIIEESSYNNGFKFRYKGTAPIVNVVALHPLDFCAWLWTTMTMYNAAERGSTWPDKNDRHRKFELCVLTFKTVMAQSQHYALDGAESYYDSVALHDVCGPQRPLDLQHFVTLKQEDLPF